MSSESGLASMFPCVVLDLPTDCSSVCCRAGLTCLVVNLMRQEGGRRQGGTIEKKMKYTSIRTLSSAYTHVMHMHNIVSWLS